MVAQDMLDGICAAILEGIAGVETRVHVHIDREIEHEDGVSVRTEFIAIEGFKCAATETCGRPFHVRVYGGAGSYEYPEHLEHRGDH
jgi:hypothetical protein